MADRSEQNALTRRLRVSFGAVCLLLGLLGVRLWYLQCVYGGYYRDLSENNRTRTVRTAPPRGMVFDREDRVLVRNRPAFDIALMLEDTPNIDESLRKIAELTGRDFDQLKKQFQSRPRGRHFEPQVVLADVNREELARIKVNTYRLPGVIVRAVPTREYPETGLAAQILGYSREI
jgi:penicillin-binding protein 2